MIRTNLIHFGIRRAILITRAAVGFCTKDTARFVVAETVGGRGTLTIVRPLLRGGRGWFGTGVGLDVGERFGGLEHWLSSGRLRRMMSNVTMLSTPIVVKITMVSIYSR